MNAYRGPLAKAGAATLGSSAAAGVGIIAWCAACGHQTEPDPAEMAARYGAATTLAEWQRDSSASSAATMSSKW